jgi:hypothetical protein
MGTPPPTPEVALASLEKFDIYLAEHEHASLLGTLASVQQAVAKHGAVPAYACDARQANTRSAAELRIYVAEMLASSHFQLALSLINLPTRPDCTRCPCRSSRTQRNTWFAFG